MAMTTACLPLGLVLTMFATIGASQDASAPMMQVGNAFLQAKVALNDHDATWSASLPEGSVLQHESSQSSTSASRQDSLISSVLSKYIHIEPEKGWEDFQKYQPSRKSIFIGGTSMLLFYSVIALLWRKTASHEPVGPQEQQTKLHGFEYGLFDTTHCSLGLVCASFFCISIMWPTTVSNNKVKLLDFWVAFFLGNILVLYNGIAGGFLGLVALIVMVYFRQSIRAHYQMEKGTAMTLLEDCFVWCCCCFCAAAQEYRQVEYIQAKQSV